MFKIHDALCSKTKKTSDMREGKATTIVGLAVNAEVFVTTILHGLYFHAEKFSWVRVAHET